MSQPTFLCHRLLFLLAIPYLGSPLHAQRTSESNSPTWTILQQNLDPNLIRYTIPLTYQPSSNRLLYISLDAEP